MKTIYLFVFLFLIIDVANAKDLVSQVTNFKISKKLCYEGPGTLGDKVDITEVGCGLSPYSTISFKITIDRNSDYREICIRKGLFFSNCYSSDRSWSDEASGFLDVYSLNKFRIQLYKEEREISLRTFNESGKELYIFRDETYRPNPTPPNKYIRYIGPSHFIQDGLYLELEPIITNN